jgi:hypothetical protein
VDDLVRLPVLGGHDPDGVLDCNRHTCLFVELNELHKEVDAFLLSAIRTLLWEPPRSTARKVGTWRKGDHQIEIIVDDFHYIALVMGAGSIRRKQITRGSMVALRPEMVSNDPTEFTCDKDFQNGHL